MISDFYSYYGTYDNTSTASSSTTKDDAEEAGGASQTATEEVSEVSTSTIKTQKNEASSSSITTARRENLTSVDKKEGKDKINNNISTGNSHRIDQNGGGEEKDVASAAAITIATGGAGKSEEHLRSGSHNHRQDQNETTNINNKQQDKKRAGSSTPKPATKKSRPTSFQEIQSIRYQFLNKKMVENLTTPATVKKKLIALLTEPKNRIVSKNEIQNSFEGHEEQKFLRIAIDELIRESRLQKCTVENQVCYMLPDGGREEEEGDVDFATARYYYQDRATLSAGLELYNRRRFGISRCYCGICGGRERLVATEMWFLKEVGEDNCTPCFDCGVGVSELGTEYFQDCDPASRRERDHALCVGCMGRRLKKEAGTNLSNIQKSLIPLRRAQPELV